MGLKAGFALDLTEFDDNGKTWDLSDPQIQRRVLENLREEKAWLLVVSSLRTPLSQLQHGNNGLKHLAFAVVLCLEQAAAGRKFALEHAAQASLCESDILKVLMRQSGASRINLGHCTMGAYRSQEIETRSFREEAVKQDRTEKPVVCRDENHEHPTVVCSEQTTHPRFSREGQNLILEEETKS